MDHKVNVIVGNTVGNEETVEFTLTLLRIKDSTRRPLASDPDHELACYKIEPDMYSVAHKYKVNIGDVREQLCSFVEEIAKEELNKDIKILNTINTQGDCISFLIPVDTA